MLTLAELQAVKDGINDIDITEYQGGLRWGLNERR